MPYGFQHLKIQIRIHYKEEVEETYREEMISRSVKREKGTEESFDSVKLDVVWEYACRYERRK